MTSVDWETVKQQVTVVTERLKCYLGFGLDHSAGLWWAGLICRSHGEGLWIEEFISNYMHPSFLLHFKMRAGRSDSFCTTSFTEQYFTMPICVNLFSTLENLSALQCCGDAAVRWRKSCHIRVAFPNFKRNLRSNGFCLWTLFTTEPVESMQSAHARLQVFKSSLFSLSVPGENHTVLLFISLICAHFLSTPPLSSDSTSMLLLPSVKHPWTSAQ